ncbi:succinylglutamate desuccinylase/aspartoacylase family protein [Parvularcula maris]|uniref:Succinylglutamate desuccinylase/aspartoacylase family protein n=1 Tax=Parvularcula maris TaxID=2965077 RepID=A0A9X2RIV1_9PROT|nr:succinylglutamate desuccinylase/aspartoacylase family protein [Parvularcula maris]MCQ8186449.1 succinylglutamate desuccinylase/aspartoacylase family protein [Parvularcula maris]
MLASRPDFIIGHDRVAPGTRQVVDLPLSLLADHTQIHMDAEVLHGERGGPVAFVSAAIHGDEIIGVEIVRQLAQRIDIQDVCGTVILVPVVNTYGFISLSRYLPDRRDLNRSFPGTAGGSLASQLAHTFMKEIVRRSAFGIDLHSGAVHRENLPQIRADLESDEVRAMAEAFAAPVMLSSKLRDGSLREAACETGCNVLLYEAGEALRFEGQAVTTGVEGVLRVLSHRGVLKAAHPPKPGMPSAEAMSSYWTRASMGGLFRTAKKLGERVAEDEVIGAISDPLGKVNQTIRAREGGIVIGLLNMPVVNRGDALMHIATLDAASSLSAVTRGALEDDPLYEGMDSTI